MMIHEGRASQIIFVLFKRSLGYSDERARRCPTFFTEGAARVIAVYNALQALKEVNLVRDMLVYKSDKYEMAWSRVKGVCDLFIFICMPTAPLLAL